jgi:predicted helicase
MLSRLPLVEDLQDFWAFRNAGKKLAELHINYEIMTSYPDLDVIGEEIKFFTVEKKRFPKKEQKNSIIYNSKIIIANIPAKAYEYFVNGKSALDWNMERYQVTTPKESGITNDPIDWAAEVGNPRYILDLLLSVINDSVQTVDIGEGLSKLRFDTSNKLEAEEAV